MNQNETSNKKPDQKTAGATNGPAGSSNETDGHGHHHIVPDGVALKVFGGLICLTVTTVVTSHLDLGVLNFPLAMFIATIKALLVVMFFMALKYDTKENTVIFASAFVFVAIFFGLVAPDIFFRGDVYVKKGQALIREVSGAGSTIPKGWISTPELVAKGKTIYATQCSTCHGVEGKGDGAAAAALNPKPRNFTQDAGWKVGRKPSQVYATLKTGIPGSAAMPVFGSLSQADRWALVHFVRSLAAGAPEDTNEDLAKIGIDPANEVAEKVAPSISVEMAMERMTEAPAKLVAMSGSNLEEGTSAGAKLYRSSCFSCHGQQGSGGIRVKNLGVKPASWVVTRALNETDAMASQDKFNKAVILGVPGSLMPGMAQFSATDLRDIYQFLKTGK